MTSAIPLNRAAAIPAGQAFAATLLTARPLAAPALRWLIAADAPQAAATQLRGGASDGVGGRALTRIAEAGLPAAAVRLHVAGALAQLPTEHHRVLHAIAGTDLPSLAAVLDSAAAAPPAVVPLLPRAAALTLLSGSGLPDDDALLRDRFGLAGKPARTLGALAAERGCARVQIRPNAGRSQRCAPVRSCSWRSSAPAPPAVTVRLTQSNTRLRAARAGGGQRRSRAERCASAVS